MQSIRRYFVLDYSTRELQNWGKENILIVIKIAFEANVECPVISLGGLFKIEMMGATFELEDCL